MSDVNLSISQEVVKPIIEAKIQAAILNELQGSSAAWERIVTRVLMAKVDSEGKESCYARDLTYIQWLCSDGIRRAAQNAVVEATEKLKPQLQALIVKELEKNKGNIAGALVGFFIEASKNYYQIKTDVTIVPHQRP